MRELTESKPARFRRAPSDPEALVRPTRRAEDGADGEGVVPGGPRSGEALGDDSDRTPSGGDVTLPGEEEAGDVVAGDDAPRRASPWRLGSSTAPPKPAARSPEALETAGDASADAAPAEDDSPPDEAAAAAAE